MKRRRSKTEAAMKKTLGEGFHSASGVGMTFVPRPEKRITSPGFANMKSFCWMLECSRAKGGFR